MLQIITTATFTKRISSTISREAIEEEANRAKKQISRTYSEICSKTGSTPTPISVRDDSKGVSSMRSAP